MHSTWKAFHAEQRTMVWLMLALSLSSELAQEPGWQWTTPLTAFVAPSHQQRTSWPAYVSCLPFKMPRFVPGPSLIYSAVHSPHKQRVPFLNHKIIKSISYLKLPSGAYMFPFCVHATLTAKRIIHNLLKAKYDWPWPGKRDSCCHEQHVPTWKAVTRASVVTQQKKVINQGVFQRHRWEYRVSSRF